MGGVSIRMKSNSTTNVKEIMEALKNELNAELICERVRNLDGIKVALLTFEKYYLRNASYASLTVMITKSENFMTADIVGSGGGEGLFNISWGVNSEFAEAAVKVLKQYRFDEELKV